MVRYKFLIVEEEGLKVSKGSVWVTIVRYKGHGTNSCLLGSVQLTLQQIVRELHNSYLTFGNIRILLMIT